MSQPGQSMTTMNASAQLQITRCPCNVLDEAYGNRQVPTLANGHIPMDVFIPKDQGHFLYSLVRALRPAISIEIGMANGLSTTFIAQALYDNGGGRHIAIDPFQQSEWQGAGLALVRSAHLEECIEFREQYSHHALADLERAGIRAQFAFVDGSHLFDYVISDFLGLDRILDVGGLIAFDDSDWPAITQALRFILANRHYEVAYPEVVIEAARYTPTLAGRLVRAASRAVPRLSNKLRDDFVSPSFEMGIRGRCVVLRKLRHDDRNSQSRHHRSF